MMAPINGQAPIKPDQQPDRAEGLAAAALTVTAFLFPLIGLAAPLGLAPLGAAASLACLPLFIARRAWRDLPPVLMWTAAALGVWALITILWALDGREALGGAGKLILVFAQGLIMVGAAGRLDPSRRRLLGWCLLGSICASAAILSTEYLTGRGVTMLIAQAKGVVFGGAKSSLNRGAAILALAAWPCAALLRPKWTVFVPLAAMTAMFLGDSTSTRLAIAAGMIAACAAWAAPKFALRAAAAAIIAAWIIVPTAASRMPDPHYTFQHWTWLPMSSHHRTTIWGFAGGKIAEKPLLGWGMEASRSIPGADEEIRVRRYDSQGRDTGITLTEALLPLHPHNGVLQIWLELGLVGAALAAAFLAATALAIDRLPAGDRNGRALALGMVICAFVIGCVSFGIWQSWWQYGLWSAAAFMIVGLRAPEHPLMAAAEPK